MKESFALSLLFICAICRAQLSQDTIDAMTWGAEAKVTFQVVDYDGKPVTNAQFGVAWSYDYTNRHKERVIKTDKNGHVVLEEKSRGTFTYSIEKEGYYKSSGKYSLDVSGENHVKDGRWEPWNPTVEILLKEKRNPIPLARPSAWQRVIPFEISAGFDFEAGDWVAPFGKGSIADATFHIVSKLQSDENINRADQLRVVINSEDGGFIMLRQDLDSQMKSRYTAPTDGFERSSAYPRNQDQRGSGSMYDMALNADSYIVFRIRVEKDSEGRITKSRYGKIYTLKFGDVRMDGKNGYVTVDYFLNPTDNDTNLEWDGTNLTTGQRHDIEKFIGPL